MDAPPVETIVSSVTSLEDVDVKETAADLIEEKAEESPSPAIALPPHTSPDVSFASEVTSQNSDLQKQIHATRQSHLIKKTYQYKVKQSFPVGAAENHPVGGPESGCQR